MWLRRYNSDLLATRLKGHRLLEKDAKAKDGFQIKVALAENGMIFKFFRIRRFLSSNLMSPYAARFASNARRLLERGVLAPDVKEVYYIPAIHRQVVIYPMIAGRTLREVIDGESSLETNKQLFQRLGSFLAGLHEKGIWFQSGHLNNYLERPEGGFALIDVTDVSFSGRSVRRVQRVKSLAKLTMTAPDRERVGRIGWEPLLRGYRDGVQAVGAIDPMIEVKELPRV